MNEKSKKILRWIGLLPLSVLSYIAISLIMPTFISLLFGLLFTSFTTDNNINTDSYLYRIVSDIGTSIIACLSFLYIGILIAPKKKKEVLFFLLVVSLLFIGFSFFSVNFYVHRYELNLGVIAELLTVIIYYKQTKQGLGIEQQL